MIAAPPTRTQQIREALARSLREIEEKDTRSWYLRLWNACRTILPSDESADLLYHEALTYVAGANAEGWIGRVYAKKALEQE